MIPPVDFRKGSHFAVILKYTFAMRLILIFVLLSAPMMILGQVNRCLMDNQINSEGDSMKYNRFQSVLQFNVTHIGIENRTLKYFPVIIHVVAKEDDLPVSEAQVLNQLDVLNADFAGNGANIDKLLPEFFALVGDGDIRFCLATVDPEGNATSGITYTYTDIDNIALKSGPEGRVLIHYDQLGGKTGWDPTQYINIWVGEYGDILGSASFPGAAPFTEEIGVVIDTEHFGSIGDAGNSGFYGGGHTLTHEMGHFFGLRHIWGNGFASDCEDSDNIPDTPNAEGPYFNCPSGEQVSCGTSDMYQNFMDLTDDRCLAAFTQGQVTYMQSAIEVYYPNLAEEGECTTYTDSFDDWYSQLVWSHDASSNSYVLYSDDILEYARSVQVYSADGRLAYNQQWDQEQSHLLNLRNLASGIYFVRIAQGEEYFVRTIVLY